MYCSDLGSSTVDFAITDLDQTSFRAFTVKEQHIYQITLRSLCIIKEQTQVAYVFSLVTVKKIENKDVIQMGTKQPGAVTGSNV